MLNNHQFIGFDHRRRVVISYFKFDADRNAQIFAARNDKGRWTVHKLTDFATTRFGQDRAHNPRVTSVAV